MAKKIVWTKRADKKYDAIVEYLSKEWGERVTEEFIKRIYKYKSILSGCRRVYFNVIAKLF